LLRVAVLVGFSLSGQAGTGDNDRYQELRSRMIEEQITAPGRGIQDQRVIEAMKAVPRHLFVPGPQRSQAYGDFPLPIGHGQTISQPYIVAFMTEQLDLQPGDRVLEVGTGSGYQAAILGELVEAVYTIEIISQLARSASRVLNDLGYDHVHVRSGDGYAGWPEEAPFDAIIVTCAPEAVPDALVGQLKEGGRLVIPVGGVHETQTLYVKVKQNGVLVPLKTLPVRFVPMVYGGD